MISLIREYHLTQDPQLEKEIKRAFCALRSNQVASIKEYLHSVPQPLKLATHMDQLAQDPFLNVSRYFRTLHPDFYAGQEFFILGGPQEWAKVPKDFVRGVLSMHTALLDPPLWKGEPVELTVEAPGTKQIPKGFGLYSIDWSCYNAFLRGRSYIGPLLTKNLYARLKDRGHLPYLGQGSYGEWVALSSFFDSQGWPRQCWANHGVTKKNTLMGWHTTTFMGLATLALWFNRSINCPLLAKDLRRYADYRSENAQEIKKCTQELQKKGSINTKGEKDVG